VQSSRVGSIADNSIGGSYAYRASKAALNSISKSMAMDLKEKGVTVIIMHPGYVKTALDTSGYTHSLPEAVGPEEVASKLWKVLKSKNIEHTGTFWHRAGQELPW
jgi:NAD(P)-dependent dehydrogenase (short-subunit alcohol dehydrogenase family)